MANTNPIWIGTPKLAWGAGSDGDGGTANTPLKTQNTALDGTGTIYTLFTAGASGSFLDRVRARAAGTNINTVLRLFVNNGSAHGTAANNSLIDEFTLQATTAAANSATPMYELICGILIPANYVVFCTLGTTVSSGYYVSAFYGDF